MAEYADLEISLHRRDVSSFAVEFRFSQPNSETDVRLGQSLPTHFNLNELNSLIYDPPAYGRNLTQSLFANPHVQMEFAQARASAQSLRVPLRLRLTIGPTAPELHSLHWEMLHDPLDGSPLSTNENLIFSRYLSSTDLHPVYLRAKGELRALVMAANPHNLPEYRLATIDIPAELDRAKQGLGPIAMSSLPGPDGLQKATLNNLINLLRENTYDILYMVCHGALVDGEPWLWLEDDMGSVTRTAGIELITRLKELEDRPRLLVLASCESAGARTGDALAALGPRLAEAGIPAVLAMQGKISMETMAEFMPVFFRELQRDGQIDRAMAVARGTSAIGPITGCRRYLCA